MSSLSQSLNEDQNADEREFHKKIKSQTNVMLSLLKDDVGEEGGGQCVSNGSEKKKKKKKNKNSWVPKGSNKKAKKDE